ncbi:MAG: carbon dioxide concentrating mechanism protein CcmL [Planctomycetaceae bacterium]|jgi:microcompartment protein CcmK/EutM|nr:carbon dioxide concentrating mechanism protein CcmL [Planctomycetaceae bacterium]
MRIGKVIGHVVLSRCHPAVSGFRWCVTVPMDEDDLRLMREPQAEEVIVLDELSAGESQLIGFSEGAEAQMPFFPHRKPIDAYNAAVLDAVMLDK